MARESVNDRSGTPRLFDSATNESEHMRDSQFLRSVLVLPVRDMTPSREWYASALGFETVFLNTDPEDDPEGNYAILRRDGAEVHLIRDEPPREHPWSTAGTGYLYLIVRDVEAVLQDACEAGVVPTRDLRLEDWGARAFQLTDPSGNLILVAEAAA